MKEVGTVYSVEENEILVKLKRHSACLSCGVCSLAPGGDMVIKAIASGEVKVGDQVTIEIDSISILKAVAMVYLLPTVAFLAGVLSGFKIAPLLGIYEHKEIFSILTGMGLLCASLFLARRYGIIKREDYKAKITGGVK